MKTNRRDRKIRISTILFLFLLGLGAIYGGVMLILDSSGASMQLPVDLLTNSIFKDYLLPGILLLTLNGILSIAIAVLVILKQKLAWILVIIQGLVLAGWITIQIIIIDGFYPPLHIPYYITGLVLIYLGRQLKKMHAGI